MKKIKSTIQEFEDTLSPDAKQKYDREYEALLLEEMMHAAMQKDGQSVRELAKLANVSPTIVQGLRTGKRENISFNSVYKVFNSLGYDLILKKDESFTPIKIKSKK